MIASSRLVALAGFGLIFPFLSLIGAVPTMSVFVFDGAIVGLLLLDLVLLYGQKIDITAIGPAFSYVDSSYEIRLKIVNRSHRTLKISLCLQAPESFVPREKSLTVEVLGRHQTDLAWELLPVRRGNVTFPKITTRHQTGLGLVLRQRRWTPPLTKHSIYPRRSLFQDETELIHGLASNQVGVLARRYFGKGTEFEQLKAYSRDDDFRSIDWKSSARAGRHIVRTYRPELNQSVVVLLDLGRQMKPKQGEYTNLDWSIEAAQLLASTAAREGDRVGLLAFGIQIQAYLSPGRGADHLRLFSRKIYDLEPESSEPDYVGACNYLQAFQKRRSLAVLFTQVQDPDSAIHLKNAMIRLRPTHLPLVINLAEKDVQKRTHDLPGTLKRAFRRIAAIEFVREIEKFELEMKSRGVSICTVNPESAVVASINRYLEIKREGSL